MSRREAMKVDESRWGEADKDIRRNLSMTYTSPVDFPLDWIPENMDYRWVRGWIGNELDTNNVRQAQNSGWWPVPAERHSEYRFGSLADDHVIYKEDIIRVGNLILHERPKRYGILEQEVGRTRNYEELLRVPCLDEVNDAKIPFKVKNSTTSMSREKRHSFKE